ncbi:uncharacterized protein Dwil_GK23842 [Drosophila willistoni]|uniref:C-type lectin domain-containing protein n=1 Tax=Drosophila willistoni TaxID=7260 RepID=B4MTH5_DROWI|nr:C-type lectin 37Db [Drosophila willistoni]EDW75414.1 uncharacterized protein Dwil_GK23842 [Drosophila willistoni]
MQLIVIFLLPFSVVLAQKACSYDYVKLGNTAYKLERGKVNWWDAARRCMDYGSQLASIDSEEELKEITTYLNQMGFAATEAVWFSGIGIKTGSWVSLATSKIMSFFKWAPNEPNDYGYENCLGIMPTTGTWLMYDLSCFKEYAFLCESNIKPTDGSTQLNVIQ